MAYPVVQSSTHGNGTGTSASITLPSGRATDDILVIAILADDSVNPDSWSFSPPSGWTSLTTSYAGFIGNFFCNMICWKRVDGGESSPVSITLGESEEYCWYCFLIRGAHTITAPDRAAYNGYNGGAGVTAVNPPNNSVSWGAEDNLWLIGEHHNNTGTPTGWPASVTQIGTESKSGGLGVAMAWGYRQYAASSYNPSTFTIGTAAVCFAWNIAFRPSAASPQTISSAGAISSAEAFGTQKINLEVSPSAISSLEAIGSLEIVIANIVSPDGIASLEAIGSLNLAQDRIFLPDGIASAEAFGTQLLNFLLYASSISSAEALGTNKLNFILMPSALDSAEGIGTIILVGGTSVIPIAASADDGYASTGYFGDTDGGYIAGYLEDVLYVAWFRFPVVIPDEAVITEAFLRTVQTQTSAGMQLQIRADDQANPDAPDDWADLDGRSRTTAKADWDSGYGDSDWHDTPDFSNVIQELVDTYDGVSAHLMLIIENDGASGPTNRQTGLTIDSTYVPELHLTWEFQGALQTVIVSAVSSAEEFGTLKNNFSLAMSSISSAEALGTQQLNFILKMTGLETAEALGTQKVNFVLKVTGLETAEALGTNQLNFTINVNGIETNESIGTVLLKLYLLAQSIASLESHGEPQLNYILKVNDISSAESIGSLNVINQQFLITNSILTSEIFGTTVIVFNIAVSGIPSLEEIGSQKINFIIKPNTLISEEMFGTIIVVNRQLILTGDIESLESIGTLTLYQILKKFRIFDGIHIVR